MKLISFLIVVFSSLSVFAESFHGTAYVTLLYSSSAFKNQAYSCDDYWVSIWETKRANEPHRFHYRSDYGGCGTVPKIGGIRVEESYEVIGEDLYSENVKVGTFTKNEISFSQGAAPLTLKVQLTKNRNGSITARQFFTEYDKELTVLGNLPPWTN